MSRFNIYHRYFQLALLLCAQELRTSIGSLESNMLVGIEQAIILQVAISWQIRRGR